MIINELLGESRPVTAPAEDEEDYMNELMGEVDEGEMEQGAKDMQEEEQK